MNSLLELSSDFYWETDAEHRLQRVQCGPHTRLCVPTAQALGKRRWELAYVAPDEAAWQAHRATLDAQLSFRDFEFALPCSQGDAPCHYSISGEPVFDGEGRFTGYRGVGRDITRRVQAEQALRESEARVRVIADSMPAMIAYTDRADRIVYANRRYRDFYVGPGKAIEGMRLREVLRPEQLAQIEPNVDRARAGETVHYMAERYDCDGAPRTLEVTLAPRRDDRDQVVGIYTFILDVTERVRYQRELERQANFDSLTGLPNRNLFNDRLAQAIATAKRTGQSFALMLVDMDQLKRINDSLGHETGDKVIAAVGQRLAEALRGVDTVARLGGDEFVALLPGRADEDSAGAVATRLLNFIGTPIKIGGYEFVLGASVGVALFPRDGTDGGTLLRHADTALYRAKEDGRNCFRFFAAEMTDRVVRFMAVENDLRAALERQEFELFYQPVVHLQTGEMVGAEALIRWRRADGSVVYPAEFVPVAEESGLIVPIGRWVIECVARQAAAWNAGRSRPFHVALNLSARQFRDAALVDTVRSALEASKASPTLVTLEITESTVMHNVEEARKLLRKLSALGVRIAVDDFGTGYSSLGYLRSFPIDVLKIDRSFVRDLILDRDAVAICRSVVALGKGLQLETVAEGVENDLQANVLRKIGCDLAQGYRFGVPVKAEDLGASRSAEEPPKGKTPAARLLVEPL